MFAAITARFSIFSVRRGYLLPPVWPLWYFLNHGQDGYNVEGNEFLSNLCKLSSQVFCALFVNCVHRFSPIKLLVAALLHKFVGRCIAAKKRWTDWVWTVNPPPPGHCKSISRLPGENVLARWPRRKENKSVVVAQFHWTHQEGELLAAPACGRNSIDQCKAPQNLTKKPILSFFGIFKNKISEREKTTARSAKIKFSRTNNSNKTAPKFCFLLHCKIMCIAENDQNQSFKIRFLYSREQKHQQTSIQNACQRLAKLRSFLFLEVNNKHSWSPDRLVGDSVGRKRNTQNIRVSSSPKEQPGQLCFIAVNMFQTKWRLSWKMKSVGTKTWGKSTLGQVGTLVF